MSRFAAFLDRRAGHGRFADRVEADLARRTGGSAAHWSEDGVSLWQGRPRGGRARVQALGPLRLAGELDLTDLPALRGLLGADPDSDAAGLILAAWARWGEAALDHLCGSFAFVLWDDRTRRLTAVRDRFGVHALTYATTAHGAVFGSDLSTIIAGLDDVPEIDPLWVSGFLSGFALDMVSSAWRGVHRLAPGHMLTMDAQGKVQVRAWYRLEAARPTPAHEAGEALRAALAHATDEACKAEPTATMLSGGLDSSTLSLLSVRQGECRPALSLRYQDPDLDEGRFIGDVLTRAQGRLEPVSLPGEDADARLFDLERQLDFQDQPFFAPGLSRNQQLHRAARDLGYHAILNGHGGDEVIGGTTGDIALMAQGRTWPLAIALSIRHARFGNEPVGPALGHLLATNGRHGFGRIGRMASRHLSEDTGPTEDPRALVHPDLAHRTHLNDHLRELHRPAPQEPEVPPGVHIHAEMVAGPMAAVGFEILGRAGQAESVREKYPFFDHRVVELCVWQPPRAKVANGQPRSLLRHAMRGVLPDSVRLRRDKANFLQGFWTSLQRDPQGRFASFAQDPGPLQGWVDAATLAADARHLASTADPSPHAAFRLWRALCLATWLDRGAAPNLGATLLSDKSPAPVFVSS